MDELVKVYEEESMTIRKVWLNEILEEKAIPYKNDAKRRNPSQIVGELQPLQAEYTIEVYVYESDVSYVKELIKKYENAEFDKTNVELKGDTNDDRKNYNYENKNEKGKGPIIFNL